MASLVILSLTILIPINGLILVALIRHRQRLEEKHLQIKQTIASHQKMNLRNRFRTYRR